MDDLQDLGISREIIEKIKDHNDPALIFNFICSFDNVIKNIEYFKSIGIEVIDTLLVNRLEFLLVDHNKIKEAFDDFDTLILVKLINEDINAINLL